MAGGSPAGGYSASGGDASSGVKSSNSNNFGGFNVPQQGLSGTQIVMIIAGLLGAVVLLKKK